MSPSITSTLVPLGQLGGLFPSPVQRATHREGERVLGEALVARTRERERARLGGEVLEQLGALTALESHLIQIVPLGEVRFKAIVDSVALGATTSIVRL